MLCFDAQLTQRDNLCMDNSGNLKSVMLMVNIWPSNQSDSIC